MFVTNIKISIMNANHILRKNKLAMLVNTGPIIKVPGFKTQLGRSDVRTLEKLAKAEKMLIK